MDDQIDGVKPDDGEEAIGDTTPVSEPKAPETETEPNGVTKPTGEEKPEGETATEGSSKKGAEARIRELNAQKKAAEAERDAERSKTKSLAEQIEELTGASRQEPQAPTEPSVEPGSEVSPEQYKSDVMKTADALVQLRIEQQNVIARINKDANAAMTEYKELDPDHESFNKDLSDAVTEATMAYVRANPRESTKKFIDKLMKPHKQAVAKEVAQEKETLVKQVSDAAMRPTTVVSADKKPEDMSIEELEKSLTATW